METYISVGTTNQMSLKQFHKKVKTGSFLPGGYTVSRPVGPDELAVWDKVLAMPDIDAELAAKGAPTTVKSQVVNGINYMFTFADDSRVTVYYQSCTDTLQVTKYERGPTMSHRVLIKKSRNKKPEDALVFLQKYLDIGSGTNKSSSESIKFARCVRREINIVKKIIAEKKKKKNKRQKHKQSGVYRKKKEAAKMESYKKKKSRKK